LLKLKVKASKLKVKSFLQLKCMVNVKVLQLTEIEFS